MTLLCCGPTPLGPEGHLYSTPSSVRPESKAGVETRGGGGITLYAKSTKLQKG